MGKLMIAFRLTFLHCTDGQNSDLRGRFRYFRSLNDF